MAGVNFSIYIPSRAGVGNVRPAGHIRPATGFWPAREQTMRFYIHLARERSTKFHINIEIGNFLCIILNFHNSVHQVIIYYVIYICSNRFNKCLDGNKLQLNWVLWHPWLKKNLACFINWIKPKVKCIKVDNSHISIFYGLYLAQWPAIH